jgi:hypothetical protein
VLPPAAIVASKAMAKDPRAEPKYAERIRYVVVHGEPGARLVDMVGGASLAALFALPQPLCRDDVCFYSSPTILHRTLLDELAEPCRL